MSGQPLVLSGTRVLDVTNAVAGSSATRVLASLGADVIKIEPPGSGEYTRVLFPYMFELFNRGKRSVAIDLKHPEGVGLLKRLAAGSDVLVQSMRPGLLEELGIGRGALEEVNPRLIHASFSAFGSQGPERSRRGVDGVVQAESGLASLQGRVLGATSYVDAAAGLALSQAILAALMARDRHGKVDSVEVSLLDTALYLQSVPIAMRAETGESQDQATYDIQNPLVGLYDAADGRIYIAPYWERDWGALCEVIGALHLLDDERFSDASGRRQNRAALRQEVSRGFSSRPVAAWVRALEARGILAGAHRALDEVVDHPQVAANEALQRTRVADGRELLLTELPMRMGGGRLGAGSISPALGADTRAVLAELGLDDDEVDRLEDLRVVAGWPVERGPA